ncbi:restriction endonuclease subunit S [candidate division WOR-3 bacterium]|nr:restriction endonuclease subunit S [candidate division WOR-3 bacterium]
MNKKFEQTKTRKIPKEWEVAKLGNKNIVDLIMGQSPPSSTYNRKGKGLPFLQGKAEFGKIYPSPLIYCSQPIRIAEKNDLLLSVRAPVGDVNITPFKSCIGRGLTAIRPKSNRLHYLYLFYCLAFNKRIFKSLAAGSTFKAIRRNEIERIPIPLPPLLEQQKIAEVLGIVDEAIEKVDKAIEKTQRLKKGLMQQLLTKGIGHKEFKDTKVGKIPKEWEVLKLGEVCNQRREIIHPTNKKNLRFVGLEHLVSGENSLRTYAPSTSIKSTKFRFFSNDILYGKLRPYLDKAVITDFDGICSTDLIVLVPEKNRVIGKLLTYIIHSKKFINIAISTTAGTNHPRTSWNAISKFKFALPSLLVQKKIAEILNTVDNRLEFLRIRKEKFERIKKGLMNDLLTGEKRVRV